MNKHLIWNEMWWLILILQKNISIHVCSIMFDPCCTMFCQEHTHANDFTGGESELVKWNLYHILLGIRLRSKWMESKINGVIGKEWGFMNLNGIARFNPIRIFQFLNFTFFIMLPSKNTTNTIIDPIDLLFFSMLFLGKHDGFHVVGLLGSACLSAVGGRKDTMAVML